MTGARPELPVTASSIYVHAPFCARRCLYCDFAVAVRSTGELPAWIEALEGELSHIDGEGLFSLPDRLETLYVGGGTPSLMGPAAMAELRRIIGHERLEDPGLEWTAEANPESLTADVAEAWCSAGVNRISLGAQSFDPAALRWMGRLHGAEGPGRAVDVARASGIENLSVDLIFGLPAHVGRSWRDDLRRVVELDVPHISLYGLTVESGTALGRAVQEGREAPVDEAQYRDEFLMAADVLTAAGYRHYEVSNFARPGFESRHNAMYWQGRPYLGLGNAAHSYAHPIRRWNLREWEAYREAAVAGSGIEAEREVLDEAAQTLEAVWLALRTDRGLALPTPGSRRAELVSSWRERDLAHVSAGRFALTSQGWLLLDRLAVDYDHARSG